jgi:hypothetical protein
MSSATMAAAGLHGAWRVARMTRVSGLWVALRRATNRQARKLELSEESIRPY